jgi:diguanylate cyclase (GGDEF)-like protein
MSARSPLPLGYPARTRARIARMREAVVGSKATILVFVAMWTIGLVALATVMSLQTRVDHQRRAQVVVATMTRQVGDLAVVAFEPDLAVRTAAPTDARATLQLGADKRAIGASLSSLARLSGRSEWTRIDALNTRYFSSVDQIVALVARGSSLDAARAFGRDEQPGGSYGALLAELRQAGASYNGNAVDSRRYESIGTALAFLFMLLAFSFTLYRATRLAHEKNRLLARSQIEALTDALTGLPNRRRLFADMEVLRRQVPTPVELALGMFDLDGFKEYNDTFGHPAGDDLLARLGRRLAATVEGRGSAYRMGGDEFCVIARGAGAEGVLVAAADALSERGDRYNVTCSSGSLAVDPHAMTLEQALQQADRLLYDDKRSSRPRASRRMHEPLARVIAENRLLQAIHGQGAPAAGSARNLELAPRQTIGAALNADRRGRVGIARVNDLLGTAPPFLLGRRKPRP